MYSVSETSLPDDLLELRDEWLDLCARANHSFFMSWPWVSNWLQFYKPDATIVRVYKEDCLVCMAVLVTSQNQHLQIFSSTCLNLGLTGNERQDQIWPEYNHVLVDESHRAAAIASLWKHVSDQMEWDELVVGAITGETKQELEDNIHLKPHVLWSSKSYGVDLEALSRGNTSFLDSLSRNTRYQINRAVKEYRKHGEIEFRKAGSVAEATQFFEEAGPMHVAKWGRSLSGSGYVNPEFVGFHKDLIQREFDQGYIDIFRLQVGGETKSFIYNYVYEGQVLFYLGAMVSEENSKLKPGLIAHSLCIQHYADLGLRYYDFMAGEHRYKLNLGKESERQYRVSFQKQVPLFVAEQALRRLKRVLFPS